MNGPVLALVWLAVSPNVAYAQDLSGWDFAQDPAREFSVASAGYDGGLSVSVQCLAGKLSLILTGVPALSEDRLTLEASRGEGRRRTLSFSRAPAGQWLAVNTPGRAARFLRGGGQLVMTTSGTVPPVRIEADLPAVTDRLDQVIEACGYRIENLRDASADGTDLLDGTRWMSRLNLSFPSRAPSRVRRGEAEITCIVDSRRRLTDCQVEHEWPLNMGFGPAAIRGAEGVRVAATDQDAIVGKVVSLSAWSARTD